MRSVWPLGIVLLASAGVVGLALTIAARMRSFEGFSNFANLVALPLFFTSGSMYPLQDAPAWLSPVIHLNPITYAVDAMRTVVLGHGNFPLLHDLLVVLAFSLVTGTLATLSFKRAY